LSDGTEVSTDTPGLIIYKKKQHFSPYKNSFHLTAPGTAERIEPAFSIASTLT
jgi:hypothetical protein